MKTKKIEILGIPSDFGAKGLGVEAGPKEIRKAKLVEILRESGFEADDLGDVKIDLSKSKGEEHGKKRRLTSENPRIRFLDPVYEISEKVSRLISAAVEKGQIVVSLGGDHGISIGTLAGVSNRHSPLGLLWIDAHADANTPETSPSGNLHGMSLAIALGFGHPKLTGLFRNFVRGENVAIIGTKDLDRGEIELLKKLKVRYFSLDEIEERGIGNVFKEAVRIVSRGTAGIHLSFDLDAVDEIFAPGVGMPNRGGLTYREVSYMTHEVGQLKTLKAIDVVELKAESDVEGRTAKLAVEIILRSLGINFSYFYDQYLKHQKI